MTVVRRPLSLHVLTGERERGRGARGMRFHESKSQCAIISLKAVLSPLIILSFRHAHLAMIINELLRSSTPKEKKHHYYHSTHPNDMSSALFCPWQIWCAQLFNMPNATCSSTHGVMWSVNWKMWFRRNRSLPLSLRNDSLIHIHNARWMWFPLSLSRSNCVNSTPLHWQQILDSVTAHRWREYRKRQKKTREREKKAEKLSRCLTNEIRLRDMWTCSLVLSSSYVSIYCSTQFPLEIELSCKWFFSWCSFARHWKDANSVIALHTLIFFSSSSLIEMENERVSE